MASVMDARLSRDTLATACPWARQAQQWLSAKVRQGAD